jgi:aspartyl-tRNA(Asn)/glutamyl-tRNA(Gln) amidotransferase subunit C
MAISRRDVEHVARLARLGLDDQELERMAAELSHILDALRALDTSAIPPTAQVIPLRNVMRDDVPRDSWPVEEILRNAPASRDQQFLVPPVLD